MATNLKALTDALKLLVDFTRDTVGVAERGGSVLLAAYAYKNLVPDIVALLPEVGDLGAELNSLSPGDYVTLIESLVADLELTEAAAGSVAEAGAQLLGAVTHTVQLATAFMAMVRK